MNTTIQKAGLWLLLLFIQHIAFSQNKEKIQSYLKIIEAGKQDTTMVRAYNELATELLGNADEKAKEYGYKALNLSKKLQDRYMTSWSYNIIGLAYDYMGKSDSALYNYQEAIKIKQQLNDYDGLGAVNMNIGVLYYYQDNTDNAMKYYAKSMDYYQKAGNQNKIAGILNNIGIIYRKEKKYTDALKTFEKAYEIKQHTHDTTGMANALGNMGVVYQYMGQYKKAEEFHLKSMHLDSLKLNQYNLVSSFISLAELNFYNKEYSKTKTNLDKAIAAGNKINAIHYLDDAYKMYTQLDSITGDYKAGYLHLKQFNIYNAQVLQDERLKQMDKLETVFSTKEKEQQINLLNANAEIKELKIKEQNRQILIFIIVSVLLLSLLTLVIIGYRSIRKQRRELQEKNEIINTALEEKDYLLKEIHHRVKNNLQVISSLLSIQSRYIKDQKALDAINESKDRVHAISVLHQEIYQNEVLKSISAATYFENLAKGIQNTFDPEKTTKLETNIAHVLMDIDQLIPLGLIVNELLTNAFKYGCSNEFPLIKLTLDYMGDEVKISVSDNGKGIDTAVLEKKNDSLGLKLITMFTQKLKGEISYANQNGTFVQLNFRLKHAI